MSYFVTGTDTGVGKTLVSCALLHAFALQGMRVAGFKPVAAGIDSEGHNDDVVRLRAVSTMQLGYEQVNPYCFREAIAPHIAARNESTFIELPRILNVYRDLAAQCDMVIVEGAGGFLVPLNNKQTGADLAKELGLQVILVVGMRLGCLNHALLTVEAIGARGLILWGWVANVLDADGTTRRCEASGAGVPSNRLLPQTAGYAITSDLASVAGSPSRMASSSISNVSKADMSVLQENISALRERIEAPLLGVVPYMGEPDARSAADCLELEYLERSLRHSPVRG
jgi:dethiobiotin synthetase